MIGRKTGFLSVIAAMTIAAAGSAHAGVELTTNGGFESGDTSGWTSFPTTNSTFDVTTNNPYAGTYAGHLTNSAIGSAAVIKQANLGVGTVNPGDQIAISFWARGSAAAGGVQFAEFFSELNGGGVSKSEILGGKPLFLTSTWTQYNFTTTAGADVSGGVTLQLDATTGAVSGSQSTAYFDNVSVKDMSATPEPASLSLLGLGGLLLTRRRRKAQA